MRSLSVRKIAVTGVTAAIYVVLTVCLPSLSYGAIQLRIAECLTLLCFYRKEYCAAMSVGCFIANMFSPMPLDMLVGTAATVAAVIPMSILGKNREKLSFVKMLIASLCPVVSNGLIVGAQLHFVYGEPFWLSVAQVAVGELLCVSVLGVILFRLLEKNTHFMRVVNFQTNF